MGMRSGYRPAVNPLHSVQRKLEWADKHIVDLGHELAGFRVAKAKAVIRENDPNRPGYSRWILTDANIPDPITLILGDAIHNLRSALDHFATVPEIISLYRLTGEDCFLIDIHAADAERLEALVDSIARFGPVTTSLVLRSYPPKPITPTPS